MSKKLEGYGGTNLNSLELGDKVSFDHEGERLIGEIARIYASRTLFHVEVNGERYSVDVDDDIQKEK